MVQEFLWSRNTKKATGDIEATRLPEKSKWMQKMAFKYYRAHKKMVDGHARLVTKDQNESECQIALLTVVAWINLMWNRRKWPQCSTFLWSWKKRETSVRTPLQDYVGINTLTSSSQGKSLQASAWRLVRLCSTWRPLLRQLKNTGDEDFAWEKKFLDEIRSQTKITNT